MTKEKEKELISYLKSKGKNKKVTIYGAFYQYSTSHLSKYIQNPELHEGGIRYSTGFSYEVIPLSDIQDWHKGKSVDIRGDATLGADPELFITQNSVVVPSTLALPEILTADVSHDGIQIELQPPTVTCRQGFASTLSHMIVELNREVKHKKLALDFSIGTHITNEVWKKTPLSLRRFGCNPTLNAYTKVDKRTSGLREKFRAGGGHIHLGSNYLKEKSDKELEDIVKVMDIVAGNSFVLIDRSDANILRRKNYGRAGEYRRKEYGLEYRVLSNFWLRHYVFASMAWGLVRNAVGIDASGFTDKLLKEFDMSLVRKAINENDSELALSNFRILKNFVVSNNLNGSSGITCFNTDRLEKFLLQDNPLSTFNCNTTPQIVKGWDKYRIKGGYGFEMTLQDY